MGGTSFLIDILTVPELPKVALESAEREGPVVATLPVTVIILLCSPAICFCEHPDGFLWNQIKASILLPLLSSGVGVYDAYF
jgi:hypothetical protein